MDARMIEIADHYGYDAQSRQLIEEMAELTQAINRFWRKTLECGKVEFTCEDAFRETLQGAKEMEGMIQEIADVEVCLEQVKYMLDSDEKIDQYREYKIRRQLYRMQTGKREES